ncbi:hypothetical protein AVEN_106660-1 [Araneus ventricosus]|uniref:Uncharacterized protein n=1 Tax=Araneus ventricosus TaxID=182803 RepID=A0A4Y2RR98_ARAVE|nr:hypothetical protein AVEN_106660-1 [Araneus ventricosus]
MGCEVLKAPANFPTERVTGPPRSLAESGWRKGRQSLPRLRHPGGSSFEIHRHLTSSGHTRSKEDALRTPSTNAIEELKTEFCDWEKGPISCK